MDPSSGDGSPDGPATTAVVELGAGVVRRAARLADGRELFYYDDADTALGPERAVDARTLDPRPETATMRYDVLTGDWISVAAARQNRAFLPPKEQDPLAPQTPGNPSEVPARYDVAVFENRSPSFGPALPGPEAPPFDPDPSGFGHARPSYGRCEVVCFSPEHEGSFGTLTPSRARTVIEAWADRTRALSALSGVAQVFPFENRGKEIGVTLPHPHGQIYAYPTVTPRTRRLLDRISAHGPDLFADLLASEREGGRIVIAGTHWTAFVPFAARWPVEVHLLPHRHVHDLAGLSEAEKDELAPLYLRLLRGVDALYGYPGGPASGPAGSAEAPAPRPTPYIAAWHQAPVAGAPGAHGRDAIRLRLELTSPRRAVDRLKYLAGSEAAMGAWIADIPPETAAATLRDAIARVGDDPVEDTA